MLDRFLKQSEFTSQEDFMANFKVEVPENFNFAYDVVDAWAAAEPERKALCWTNEQGEHFDFTFAQVKSESDRVASWLTGLGIGRGDMVMLILKRRFEFWFTIIALHKIGAVTIPATHLLTAKDIVYRCQAADIKMILTVGEELIHRHVEDARPLCPSLQYCATLSSDVPQGWLSYHDGVEQAAPFTPPAEPTLSSQPLLLYFTSGTTGNPKMVLHDHSYPLAHIVTARYWQNIGRDSLHLTLADTGWGKAVWGKLYGQWIVGASVFVYDFDKFHPTDILKMIHTHKITSFCAPPTVFRFLIREDLSKYDISSLKYGTIAGEALNPKVFNEFQRITGVKLMEGFGQTETTLIIGTYPWVEPKPGSMGVCNPQYDVDLVDAEGNSVAANEHGQIVIRLNEGRPLGLFSGYYREAERTARVIYDGAYHTGDVATRDEDGYYWFVGRMDDIIKSSGYRIGPFEVESALMTHPAVVECAVTGVADEMRGQVIKATIVLAPAYREQRGEELIKQIQNHVKEYTAPYKYPRIVEFVEELPKTISGKIRRVEIREGK